MECYHSPIVAFCEIICSKCDLTLMTKADIEKEILEHDEIVEKMPDLRKTKIQTATLH